MVLPLAPLRLLPSRSMGGSLEHFYHFMLSYFLPIDDYIAQHQPDALELRDCGPLNAWFSMLAPGTKISVMPRRDREAGEASGGMTITSDGGEVPVIVSSLESQYLPRGRTIRAARKRVLERLDLPLSPTGEVVTLINRAPSLPFYETDAEIKTSGAQRRSIPNIASLSRALSDTLGPTVPLVFFEGEHLDPTSQVRIMSQTTILIGQHGAGLAHMVFMARGGVVIEILPQRLKLFRVGKFFRTLARSCGHSYVAVTQGNNHAPVDVALVQDALVRMGKIRA